MSFGNLTFAKKCFCSWDVLLSDDSADVCKRQRTCYLMLWLDVVEITDGATSNLRHADVVGTPPIDWLKMIPTQEDDSYTQMQ